MTELEKIKHYIARSYAVFPFIYHILRKLEIEEITDEKICPNVRVDGRRIQFNPTFCSQVYRTPSHWMGMVSHETSHLVNKDCTRFKPPGFDPNIWMLAQEFMANHFAYDLCQTSEWTPSIPDFVEGVFNPKIFPYDKKYSDGSWTTEKVYWDLLKSGKVKYAAYDSVLSSDLTPGELVGMIAQADLEAKIREKSQPGRYPASLSRFIGDLLDSKIPWWKELGYEIHHHIADDYTFKKPNKRHLGRKLFLPSLYSEEINGAFMLDTSGSMGEEELKEGASELVGICEAFLNFHLWLFACDGDVQSVQEVTQLSDVSFSDLGKGGGGTDFRPLFDYIEKEGLDINFLVVFTDAFAIFPETPPDYNVIWVVKGSGEVPFGKRIQYEN